MDGIIQVVIIIVLGVVFLYDEIRNNLVNGFVLIKILLDQCNEVGYGIRGKFGYYFQCNSIMVGVDGDQLVF